jgi:hypothetical protein
MSIISNYAFKHDYFFSQVHSKQVFCKKNVNKDCNKLFDWPQSSRIPIWEVFKIPFRNWIVIVNEIKIVLWRFFRIFFLSVKFQLGLNFINVLCTAFTHADPKSVKRYWQLDWVLTLWGATGVKAECKTLVKLTADIYF